MPEGDLWWSKTHAMMPAVDVLEDRIRVYFSSLDESNTGRIGYVDLDKNNPENVTFVAQEPVLDIGVDGTFDDNGVNPSCIFTHDHKKYLYYYGFQLVKKARFLIYSGVAVSTDGGTSFKRNSLAPLLDRNDTDTFLRSLPFVINDNGIFKMWYTGVNEWTYVNGKKLPVGNIRYMEGNTPLDFKGGDILTCLEPLPHEFSLSRPFVFKRDGLYKMLFSIRLRETDSYTLGYAESADGKKWNRDDSRLSIAGSTQEWDSEEMCYTSVVQVNGKDYLFYNGNGFGSKGFGYAEIKF